MHSSHIQCVFFIIFYQANHAPKPVSSSHGFHSSRVNFPACIYKPEIWRVRKAGHGWQLTPRLQHLTLKTGEGQNTPYNTIICGVYSHPCFLAYSTGFVCIFLILPAIYPHTHQPLCATRDTLIPARNSVLWSTMVIKCVTSILTC